MFTSKELFERRRTRNRTKLRKVASGQPRLTVHRSSKHIYAQIIDDQAGNTMAAASTLDADFKRQARQRLMPQLRLWLASWLPSVPKQRVLRLWYLIAAVIFSMVASRRWPMPRAKPV